MIIYSILITGSTYVYLYIDSSISKGSFNDTLYSGYLYASSYQSSSVDCFLVRDLSYYTNDAISYGALLDKSNGNVTTDGIDDYIQTMILKILLL